MRKPFQGRARKQLLQLLQIDPDIDIIWDEDSEVKPGFL